MIESIRELFQNFIAPQLESIKGEIKVLTAQVQMSGYIISFLPIGLAILIFMMNPGYIMELFAWPWVCMPIGALIMVGIGFFAMKKIATIEV